MNGNGNGWKTWILGIVAAIIVLGVGGAIGVAIAVARADERIDANSNGVEAATELAHTNALAIAKITQWIEIDRDRTEREHAENVAQHEKIIDDLDEIKDRLR